VGAERPVVVAQYPSRRAGRRQRSGDSTLRRIAIAGPLLVLAVVLPLFRQRGARSWNTIWAEDGSIYLQQAKRSGGVAVLFRGHAGYLQLPTRLISSVIAALPLRDAAFAFAVSAAVIGALLALFTYWASGGWVTSRPVRVALASMIVLMPALGAENTANATNTIWIFAAVVPWAVVAMSETTWAVVARATVVFLGAAATAVSALFLPLAFVLALFRRTRGTWAVTVMFCLGLIVQGVVALHPDPSHFALGGVRSPSRLAGLTSVRVFGEFLVGDKGIGALWVDYRKALIVAAPLCIALILTLLFRRAGREYQALAGVFVMYAVVMFVVPVWERGTSAVLVSQKEAALVSAFLRPHFTGVFLPNPTRSRYVTHGLRYSVVPVFLLASALAILVATGDPRRSRIEHVCRLLFVTQVVLLTVIGLSITNGRSGGPSWATTVDEAYASQCHHRPLHRSVTIQTATGLFPVVVRCSDIK
jgi:hypothetical protein